MSLQSAVCLTLCFLSLLAGGCGHSSDQLQAGYHRTWPAPALPAAPFRLTGIFTRCPSGDTMELATERGLVGIRIHGIDAPEFRQDFYSESLFHLRDLASQGVVTADVVHLADDQLCIARLQVQGKDLGLQMLQAGMAWHNGETVEGSGEDYRQAEQQAREERRGLWKADQPVAPWEWSQPPVEGPAAGSDR